MNVIALGGLSHRTNFNGSRNQLGDRILLLLGIESCVMGQENVASVFDTELDTYRKGISEWTEHIGEFVLIKGSDVAGFYGSYREAIAEGYRRFGLDTFLVRQVKIVDQAHFVPPIGRIVDAALHASS